MNTILEKPFLRIADACAATGLSQHFLRAGCKNGSVPCVKSGKTYYIDVPALLNTLRAQQQTRAEH